MQPLLNALLTPDFDLHKSIATIPASDLPATAESATTQLSSVARLADLCESIRLTTARMAAVQLLLTVAQSTTDLNTRRLAASAILRFNPQTFRAPKPPKDLPPTSPSPNPEPTSSASSLATKSVSTAASPASIGFASTPDAARKHEPSNVKRNSAPSSPAGRTSVATGAAQQARGTAPLGSPARRADESGPHFRAMSPQEFRSPHVPTHSANTAPIDFSSHFLSDLNPFTPLSSPASLLTIRRGTALPATIPRSNLA